MNEKNSTKLITPGYTITFILVTSLFFLWALPNNLNDILIPQFMKSFELNRLQAGLVQSAFYLGYFLLAMPAALVMDKYGYKAGLLAGLLLFASGCFLFWPAALAGKYGFFLGALFVIAAGLCVSRNRFKFVYCHFGRSCKVRTTPQLIAIVQPAGLNDRRSGWYCFYFLRKRIIGTRNRHHESCRNLQSISSR